MEQRKWRTEAALVGRVLVWGAARRSGVGFQPRSPVGGGRHRARWVAAFRLSRLVSSHWTRKKTAPPPPPCSRESDADVFGRLLRRLRIGGFFFIRVCVCVSHRSVPYAKREEIEIGHRERPRGRQRVTLHFLCGTASAARIVPWPSTEHASTNVESFSEHVSASLVGAQRGDFSALIALSAR